MDQSHTINDFLGARMTEYYAPISRSVAALDTNTSELRRALYDRARAAQVNQLRKVDPPLTKSDFDRERLSLEAAIRRFFDGRYPRRTWPVLAECIRPNV